MAAVSYTPDRVLSTAPDHAPNVNDAGNDSSGDGVDVRPLNFWGALYHTGRIQCSMFLLYAIYGTTQAFLPELQDDAFGSNVYMATGVLAAVLGLMTAFAGPALGALSDTFGRGVVLAVAVAFAAVPSVIPLVNPAWSMPYLVAFSVFGILQAASGVVFSATADAIAAQARPCSDAIAMSPPVLSMLSGLTIGSFGGGAIEQYFGRRAAFGCQLGLSVFAFVFHVFAFPRFNTITAVARQHQETINNGPGFGHIDEDSEALALPTAGIDFTACTANDDQHPTSDGDAVAEQLTAHDGAAQEDGVRAGLSAPLLAPHRSGTGAVTLHVSDEEQAVARSSGARSSPKSSTLAHGARDAIQRADDHHHNFESAESMSLCDPFGLRLGPKLRTLFRVAAHIVKTQPMTRVLVPACFMNNIAEQTLYGFISVYFHNRFGFDPIEQSLCLLGCTAGTFVSVLLFIPIASRTIGLVVTTRVALCANIVVFAWLATMWEPWQVSLMLPPMAVSLAVFPAVAALATSETIAAGNGEHLGLVLGTISAARNAAGGVGPATLGVAFRSAENGPWPGWPFMICAACALFAAGLVFVFVDRRRHGLV